jgi:hypothetical protein
MEVPMPLTFDNRSRAMITPRGVMAFTARDGHKEVCCLLPLPMLQRDSGDATADGLSRAFDRHRAVIEESASELYDRHGSDECGELLLTELDLRS